MPDEGDAYVDRTVTMRQVATSMRSMLGFVLISSSIGHQSRPDQSGPLRCGTEFDLLSRIPGGNAADLAFSQIVGGHHHQLVERATAAVRGEEL